MVYNVLLVDDMIEEFDLLKENLGNSYNIAWVSTSKDLEDTDLSKFDFILADLHVDELMDNCITTSEYWKNLHVPNIPIIAYTNSDPDYIRQTCPDHPFEYILSKDMTIDFMRTILKITKKQHQLAECAEK